VYLLEMARGDDAKPGVVEAFCDLQRARTGCQRLVEFIERCLNGFVPRRILSTSSAARRN